MVTLLFSKHAVEQMFRRAISTAEVEELISKPDGSFEQSRDKRVIYKRFANRKDNLLAAVIVLQKPETYEVVTVMHNFEVKR